MPTEIEQCSTGLAVILRPRLSVQLLSDTDIAEPLPLLLPAGGEQFIDIDAERLGFQQAGFLLACSQQLKADTGTIAEATRTGTGQSGARFVTDAMMVAGGVPLYGEGVLVGAIGVSGTRSAAADQKCAEQGAEALQEKLLF